MLRKFKIHWSNIVILLVVTIFLGSLGVGLLIQNNPSINYLDTLLYEYTSAHLHSHLMDILVYPINFNFLPFGGTGPVFLYLILLPVLVYLWFHDRSWLPWFIFTTLLAFILAGVITLVDWHFVFRQRPFLVVPTDIPASAQKIWGVVSSFPSGHSRDTAIISTLVANFIPQTRIFAITLTVFVAFSRVYVGAHYPTDVIAGVLIGYLSTKASLILSRELRIIYRNKKGEKDEIKQKISPTDVKKR